MPEFLTQVAIKIDGQQVSQEFYNDLDEVVVDTSLHMPDLFTIRLHDRELEWVDNASLDIGKAVEISVETGEQQSGLSGLLIKGEITALEPLFSAAGKTALVVRGYDKSHRLHRGRKTRTFRNTRDSALIQTIASEAGLSVDADATTVTYDYVLQNNQTNMEFLMARAERIGYQVYAAEGKLYFKKGDATLGDGPSLAYADNLITFQPCWTVSGQADKMIVKGWDPKGKQAISSQKTPNAALNQGGMTQTGGDKASQAFGSAEAIITDQPVFTPDEAVAMADGLSNDINRETIQAEGLCRGDPRVKAGWTVTIEGVGKRFSGKYFVTSATHIYTSEGYDTRFSITGRQPNSLTRLLTSGDGHSQDRGQAQGVVTALVTNLNDPDDLGRVKVKYAWLGEIESDWVRISSPMAGAERGLMYLPEVNDEVLIAFEHGDVHRPYVVGALWNNTDKPPLPNSEAVASGKVNQRILKSRSGHVVILDDTDGSETITIRDKTENNEIVIDSSQNSMKISVDGDFIVEAKGKILLNSTGDMTLDSKAAGNFKAASNLSVKATGNVSVNATGNLSLEGTGMGQLKGNSVTVDGGPMATIKGGLVKIN